MLGNTTEALQNNSLRVCMCKYILKCIKLRIQVLSLKVTAYEQENCWIMDSCVRKDNLSFLCSCVKQSVLLMRNFSFEKLFICHLRAFSVVHCYPLTCVARVTCLEISCCMCHFPPTL